MEKEIYTYKAYGKEDIQKLIRTLAENYNVIHSTMRLDQVTMVYDSHPKIVWGIMAGKPIIVQFILEYEKRIGWKVSVVSEDAGILHVSCPMELIMGSGTGTGSDYSQKWRQAVRDYWGRVSKAKQQYEKTVTDFILDYGD